MNEASRAVVVRPGEGRRVGNVEFLARSEDTPRFNLALITIQPHRGGPPVHAHEAEDDAFYILEGELTFIVGDSEVVTGPGTFVLVPPGIEHTFGSRGDEVVRMLNVQRPASSSCWARLAVISAKCWRRGELSVRYRSSQRIAARSYFGEPRSAWIFPHLQLA